jgi:hypothetical protein
VRMAPGSKLQTYVMEYRAVIMDAAPILPSDAIFYFKQGLLHELKVECLTDPLGQPFASLDALVSHAFVQEQKLICRNSAPGKANAQLNNVQGPYQQGSPFKKQRTDNRGGYNGRGRGGGRGDGDRGDDRGNDGGGRGGGRGRGRGGRGGGRGAGRGGGFRERTSGRSDAAQDQHTFCMANGICGGCYSMLMPVGHFWRHCPNNPANRGMDRTPAPVPTDDAPTA